LINQKIKLRSKKIIIYKKKVEIRNIDIFFVLSEFLEEDDSVNVNDIKTIISLHLNQISIALVISQKIFVTIFNPLKILLLFLLKS